MNVCAFESKYVRDVCMRPAKETEKNTLTGNRLAPISRLGDIVAMVYEDDKTLIHTFIHTLHTYIHT